MEGETKSQGVNRPERDNGGTPAPPPTPAGPDREQSANAPTGKDLERIAASASRQSRVLLATVLSQTLKELDRDL